MLRFRDFIESVEQKEASFLEQLLFQSLFELLSDGAGQLCNNEVPQVRAVRFSILFRQAPGRKIAQHDPNRQERPVRPRLRLSLLIGILCRKWGSERIDIDVSSLQRRTREAEGDEIDERAFTAARVTHENEPLMPIEKFQCRTIVNLLFFFPAPHQVFLRLRCGCAQRRIDRVEIQRVLTIIFRGCFWIDSRQAEGTALSEQMTEIGAS